MVRANIPSVVDPLKAIEIQLSPERTNLALSKKPLHDHALLENTHVMDFE